MLATVRVIFKFSANEVADSVVATLGTEVDDSGSDVVEYNLGNDVSLQPLCSFPLDSIRSESSDVLGIISNYQMYNHDLQSTIILTILTLNNVSFFF